MTVERCPVCDVELLSDADHVAHAGPHAPETRVDWRARALAAEAERDRLRADLAASDTDCAQAWSELEEAEREILALEGGQP